MFRSGVFLRQFLENEWKNGVWEKKAFGSQI